MRVYNAGWQQHTQAYKSIFNDLHTGGISISPRDRPTIEIPETVTFHMADATVFPAIMVQKRRFNLWFALAECLWMWSGRRDVESVAFYNEGIRQFSDDGKIFHGAYGWRAVTHFQVDQIGWIIDTLRTDPYSRRLVLDIYDAANDTGAKTLDTPCNLTVVFRARPCAGGDDVLDMTVLRRSNDLIWGLPYNLVQFWWLHNMIATSAKMRAGHADHVVSSMHLYTRDYGSGSNAVLQNEKNWVLDIVKDQLTWDEISTDYASTKALADIILNVSWEVDRVDISPLAFVKVKGGAPNALYRIFEVLNHFRGAEEQPTLERINGWMEGIVWNDTRFLLRDFIVHSKRNKEVKK